MNVESIFGLVIVTFVALIMVIIGLVQFNEKEEPVGFYSGIAHPKKEEITDVLLWNKKHGIIWIIYGICMEVGYGIGIVMPNDVLEIIFMMGGVIIPLPIMILRHHMLEKEYRRR